MTIIRCLCLLTLTAHNPTFFKKQFKNCETATFLLSVDLRFFLIKEIRLARYKWPSSYLILQINLKKQSKKKKKTREIKARAYTESQNNVNIFTID